MPPFFESNIPLLAGAVLLLALVGVRAASSDATFRADLRGAVVFLFAFVVLRTGWWIVKDYLTPPLERALLVGWMLAFAFGCIRALVSVVLRVTRFGGRAPPKILRDVIDFSLYALAAVPIVKSQLEVDLTGLLATSAIVSVVLGLAVQDSLGNLFAGLSLQLERPFQVGDYVTIKEHTGKIVQIAWRATRLETFRHELVTLPNNLIAKEAIRNHTRTTQPVGVDVFVHAPHDAPPNDVKVAVLETARQVPHVLAQPAPTCRAWQYDELGVRYFVRCFIADFLDADEVVDELHARLWYRLGRDGIALPAPRRTFQQVDAGERHLLSEDTTEELLASVDIFGPLAPQEVRALVGRVKPCRFARGERIIEEGAEGQTFYVVASGEVSILIGKPPVEVARVGRGQHFGEMSLLTGEPRAATVVASRDALLLEIDRPTFAHIFEAHPGLAKQLSGVLAQRRSELRAAAQASAPTDTAPEASRIFTRLRQIFRLSHD